MINEQLQLGPVEDAPLEDALVVEGAPVALVEAPVEDAIEEEVEWTPTPLELDESFDPTTDPITGVMPDPLAVPESERFSPSYGQLAGAADIYNLAGLGSGAATVSPRNVFESLTTLSVTPIATLMANINAEDGAVKQQLIRDAMSDPMRSVADRISLIEAYEQNEPADFQMITREAVHNANWIENGQGDTPEEIEDYEAGVEYVASIPANIEPFDMIAGDEEYLRAGYTQILNTAYKKYSDDASVVSTDFTGLFVPFRVQIPVFKIYKQLGLGNLQGSGEDAALTAGNTAFLGNTLKEIRDHVSGLPTEAKIKALGIVLKELQQSGTLLDSNDYVNTHVLSQIFYKDLNNKEYPGSVEREGEKFNKAIAVGEANLARLKLEGASAEDIKSLTEFLADARKRGPSTLNIPSLEMALDNAGSLLDSVGIGSVAKGTILFGTKFMANGLRRLAGVAPKTAAEVSVDALENPALREKLGELLPADVLETFLPSAQVAFREGGVNGLHVVVQRQSLAAAHMRNIAKDANQTLVERAAAHKEILDSLGEIAARPYSTLHINASVFDETADGVKITGVFGRTPHKGYGTLGSALKASKDAVTDTFGVGVDVTIVKKTKAGTFEEVPLTASPTARGEFFLQANDFRQYSSAKGVFDDLTLEPKSIKRLHFSPSTWGIFSKLDLGWANPTSIFSKSVTNALSTQGAARTSWNKLSSGMLTEVADLNSAQTQILSRVIKDGAKVKTPTGRGTVFTPNELAAKGLNESGVLAYYSYRNAADTMWGFANTETRNTYLKQGLKDIVGPNGRVDFAKPLKTVGEAVADIKNANKRIDLDMYDAATNTFFRMNSRQLEDLYANGGTVARSSSPILGKRGAEATHIILDAKKIVKATEIPHTVLTKVDGYFPNMWQGNYVVWGVTKAGNRMALGLARTSGDAAAIVAKKKKINWVLGLKGKEGKFADYDFQLDKQLDDLGARGQIMEQQFLNLGGPVFGKRSGRALQNFSKDDGEILLDPVEALLRGMEIVGDRVTKGELLEGMRQKLLNFARTSGVLKNDASTSVRVVEDLKNTGTNAMAYKQAVAYLRQIDLTETSPSRMQEQVASWFDSAARAMSAVATATNFPGVKWAAGALADRGKNPTDVMALGMGLIHRKAIAASPFGQFTMNVVQSAMAFGIAPVAYVKALSQVAGFASLVGERSLMLEGSGLLRVSPKQYEGTLKTVSKVLGMPEAEARALVDTMLEKGLVSSTSYHTQMRSSMRSAGEANMLAAGRGVDQGANRASDALRMADSATFGALSKVGFEFGENINRVVTFLTLYNKDKGKGLAKLHSQDYVRDLMGRTMEMTGNMIPEMGAQYQRGWFKAAFQFVSFQHKMLMLTLPETIGGSKVFSGSDKAGMVLMQALLFGRRGGAHIDTFYRVVDTMIDKQAADDEEKNALYMAWNSKEARMFIDGMIMDTGVNYTMKQLFNSPTEFDISGKIAPGGGTQLIVDRLVAMSNDPMNEATGFSGDNASKVFEFMKRAYSITLGQVKGVDDVPFGERAAELTKEGGSLLFSTYDRYLTVKAAEKMGGWMSAGGMISEGFSGEVEGNMFTFFGIQTKDRASLYAVRDKYSEELNINTDKKQAKLDKLSSQYVTNLSQFYAESASQATSEEVLGTMEGRFLRQQTLLFSMLPEDEAQYVSAKVNEKIRAILLKNTSAEQDLVDRLLSVAQSGKFGAEGRSMMLDLENASFVKDHPRLRTIVNEAWLNGTETDEAPSTNIRIETSGDEAPSTSIRIEGNE